MIVGERVRRRLQATRFADIREFDTIDSTNRWLLDNAAAGDTATPTGRAAPPVRDGTVAVADYQDAGRGRRGRVWEAPAGSSLLASILLVPALEPRRWHLLTEAVGLSAAAAVREVGGFNPDLKWPNDLLAGGAKLAGVLAESRSGVVVVGIGCNVSWAPPGATSVEAVAGKRIDRGELLGALLAALNGWYGRWEEVAAAYRAACATVGQFVRVSRAGADLQGLAEGIDDDGRLLVRPVGGAVEAVAVGDVVHLRLGSLP